MKVFEGALPEGAKWLREELRWLAGVLGDVRDLDVQIENLEAWKDADGEGLGSSLGRILGVMGKRRAEARGRMLEALDSERYGRLERSFGEMLRRGPRAERELGREEGHAAGDESVTAAAPALISARYRKWRKAAKRLDESSPPDDFHDVRKEGKKLRYALEFVLEVYGEPVATLVSPLKEVQDDLGDHQDAVVAAETLRELGTTTKVPRISRVAAFAMGVLFEHHRREAADRRAEVLRSKPLRALVKRGRIWEDFEGVMEDAAKGASGAEVFEERAR
jgi:triphosphatase